MADGLQLYVLPPSHYCERARWALEHSGFAFREERLAVGLHVPRAKRIAGRSALPILVADGEVVQGSGSILDWTRMPGGHPDLERRFEGRIGVLVRQFIYAGALSQAGPNVRELLLEGVPPGPARLGRLLWPVTRRLMIAGMNARPALLPDLERKLEAELDWFEGQLAGRSYLVDGRFGRADLTVASLLAPLAEPTVSPLYRNFKAPGSLSAALARWNSRPGLLWVRRVYAAHRSAAVASAVAL